jgi:hypothetical protein
MKKVLKSALIAISFCVFAAGANAQQFKEGKWTITMVTKMDGMEEEMAEAMAAMDDMSAEEKAMMQQMMGSMNMQMDVAGGAMTATVTQCMTQQEPVPALEGQEDKDCETEHSVTGSTVKFNVVCPDSAATGEMTYTENTMSGKISSQQMMDGQMTEATITMDGQYVGPCDGS